MKLTKEQHDKLEKHEKHLRRGFYGNYTFALYKSDFDELVELYKELGGTGAVKYNCNSCVLKVTKYLGKLYFEWEPEPNPVPDEVVEAVTGDKIIEKPDTTKKKTVKNKKKTKKEGK